MDKYIIYSGGGNGYGLYEAHPAFPDAYRESVAALFERQHIVGSATAQADRFCCRFAPLQDAYVLSVIYKECTCAEESRSFFAAVNWLFTADEADLLLRDDMRKRFFQYILHSDEILEEAGYIFEPRPAPVLRREVFPTENEQKALVSAAYYATKAACEDEGRLSAQIFVGCADTEALFDNLFWILRACPWRLRKFFSFHVGAAAVSETFGVALAVTRDDVLEAIAASGDYSGSMAVKKITLVKDTFTSLGSLPSAALAYVGLSDADKQRIEVLFADTDRCNGYWQYITVAAAQGAASIKGAALVTLLGEKAFLDALAADVFSEEELTVMYAERKKLTEMPSVIAALSERVAPFAEKAAPEDEAWDKKQKKDKKDKDKKHKKENSPRDEDEADRDEDTKDKYDRKDKKYTDEKVYRDAEKDVERGKKRSEYGDKKHTYDFEDKKDTRKKERSSDKEEDVRGDDGKHKKKKHAHARPPLPVRIWRQRAALARVLWPVILPIVCLMLVGGIGYGMYYLGVVYIVALPVRWARLVYGAGLGVLLLLAMPLGYLLIAGVKRLFSRNDTPQEEESH